MFVKLELRKDNLFEVRQKGLIPGVLYGHKIEPQKIQVNYKDLIHEYNDHGYAVSFKVKIGRKSHTVFFKELQRNPLNQQDIRHFDLMKVSAKDKIKASVPLVLKGKEALEKDGKIVQVLSDTIELEFPVQKAIASLEVEVMNLKEGDTITAKDVKLPKDFTLQDDEAKVLVSITPPQMEIEPKEEEAVKEEEPVNILIVE
jgi:large subunit ribosomal protein L25